MSFASRLLLRLILNTIFAFLLVRFASSFFVLTGGHPALLLIGLALTVFDTLVQPLLSLLTLPLWIITRTLNALVTNAVCLGVLLWFTQHLSPHILTLHIKGGLRGALLLVFLFSLRSGLTRLLVR